MCRDLPGPPTRTASDAAAEILRRSLDRRRTESFTLVDVLWDWDSLRPFERIPWHQLPLLKHSPVPWFVPIGRFDQTVFAEAFRQALGEGFAVPRALELAADVNPCPCFRRALLVMHSGVCGGRPLGLSLKESRAWIGHDLPDALEVGEEFGCLAAALAAFVRQDRAFTGRRFRLAIGRRSETTRFAVALAALLSDHPLSQKVIWAAVRMSGGSRRFVASIHSIADTVNNGNLFVTALKQYPRYFDKLFCSFLDRADSRQEMGACLERLASAGDTT